jgi:hypothetical protein
MRHNIIGVCKKNEVFFVFVCFCLGITNIDSVSFVSSDSSIESAQITAIDNATKHALKQAQVILLQQYHQQQFY